MLARAGFVVFLTLLVFGLVLLFSPDLANDLDQRSGGGAADAAAVSITETKRTTEETTRSESGSTADRRTTRVANDARRGGGGRGRDASTTQESRTGETTSTTTTETTSTETVTPATPRGGFFDTVFAVPAVAVLLRLAAVALLAGVAALPLLWALRRASSGGGVAGRAPNPAPGADAAPPAPPPPPPAAARGSGERSSSRRPELPVKPVITRLAAERAKAAIIAGIPLLREVFDARGEPSISNTLPDMRVRVKLTDTITKEQPLPISLLAEDPTLGLATFRTEVEQRLRRLARDAVAQSADSTDDILRALTDEGLFEADAADGLKDLLRMCERVVGGARVDPAMGAWVREEGVSLLLSLDLMLPS